VKIHFAKIVSRTHCALIYSFSSRGTTRFTLRQIPAHLSNDQLASTALAQLERRHFSSPVKAMFQLQTLTLRLRNRPLATDATYVFRRTPFSTYQGLHASGFAELDIDSMPDFIIAASGIAIALMI